MKSLEDYTSCAMGEKAGPESTVVEPETLERLVWTLAKTSLAPDRPRTEDPGKLDRGL